MNFSTVASSGGLFCDGDWIEKKDQDPDGTVRLIQLADIGACEFKDKSSRYITAEKRQELQCTLLKKGDILIARLPDPLGRACIFPLEGNYITAVDIAILRIKRNDINSKYVMYLINSPAFRNEIKKYESGTTRKRISRKNLEKINFELPSLSEQSRVVTRIEEIFSELDNAVETLQKTKQQLEVYRQAVLDDAFNGEFEKKPLGEIAKTISGYAFKSKKYTPNGSHVVVKIGNVKPNRFDFSRDYTLTNEIDNGILDKFLLQKGDCVITLTGSRGKRDYGYVAMVGEQDNFLVNQRVAALRFDPKVANPEFYLHYLSSQRYRNQFFKYETGNVGQGNVGVKALSEPLVVVPSLDKQQQIVEKINLHLSIDTKINETVDCALSQAEALRQSILKQAFEGRL